MPTLPKDVALNLKPSSPNNLILCLSQTILKKKKPQHINMLYSFGLCHIEGMVAENSEMFN